VEQVVRTAHETIVRHGGKPDCIALVCMNAAGERGAACNHKEFWYAAADSSTAPAVTEVFPVLDKDGENKFFDGVSGYER
jgi:hypothetical protein